MEGRIKKTRKYKRYITKPHHGFTTKTLIRYFLSMPDEKPKQLTMLDLGHNKITRIIPAIFNCVMLTKIN